MVCVLGAVGGVSPGYGRGAGGEQEEKHGRTRHSGGGREEPEGSDRPGPRVGGVSEGSVERGR